MWIFVGLRISAEVIRDLARVPTLTSFPQAHFHTQTFPSRTHP